MCQPMYASSLIVKRLVKIILASSKSWCLYHYCNHLSTCSQHLPTHSFKFQIYNLIGSRTKVYFTINIAIELAGGCTIHDWVFQVNLVFSINYVQESGNLGACLLGRQVRVDFFCTHRSCSPSKEQQHSLSFFQHFLVSCPYVLDPQFLEVP